VVNGSIRYTQVHQGAFSAPVLPASFFRAVLRLKEAEQAAIGRRRATDRDFRAGISRGTAVASHPSFVLRVLLCRKLLSFGEPVVTATGVPNFRCDITRDRMR
jgi:hypothetical protein